MTTSLLILDSSEATKTNNVFSYKFEPVLQSVRSIKLKKAIVNCDTNNSVLYLRSNLVNRMINRTVATDGNTTNRNTNILAVLQKDLNSDIDNTTITSTNKTAEQIGLNMANSGKLFEGDFFRVVSSGSYIDTDDTTIYLKNINNVGWVIELTSFSTGSNDKITITERGVGDIDDYEIFEFDGSQSGSFTSAYPILEIDFNPKSGGTISLDLKIYQKTGFLDSIDGYNYTTTTSATSNKIIQYKETDATNLSFNLYNNKDNIYDLDLGFHNSLNSSPIDINSYSLVFELITGKKFN